MSVMLEQQPKISCPCVPDCPDRSSACRTICAKYKTHATWKKLEYKKRAKIKETNDIVYAGYRKAIERARRMKLAHGKRM